MATAIVTALPLAFAATTAATAAAAAAATAATAGPGGESGQRPTRDNHLHASATFLSPSGTTAATATAYTYDTGKIPAGAYVSVDGSSTGTGNARRSTISLQVYRLLPNRDYGAHVHYLACGRTGADAGAHYQNILDPAVGGSKTQMSTDPAYANPRNEVWLDLTTDAEGNGSARTTVNWHFRADDANSVVIHDHRTGHGGTGHPPAGDAGARLGCLTVPF